MASASAPPQSPEVPLELGTMPRSFFADFDVDYSTLDAGSARHLIGTIVEGLDRATGRSRQRSEVDDQIRNLDLSDMLALLPAWLKPVPSRAEARSLEAHQI